MSFSTCLHAIHEIYSGIGPVPPSRNTDSSKSRSAEEVKMRGSEETEKTLTQVPRPPTSRASLDLTHEPQQAFLAKTKQRLLERIQPSLLAEIELLILTFCTGIQDAISVPDYHCFASNQTGNTVFLALALILPRLNGDAFYTANIAVALAFFLAGGVLTGQLGAHAVPHGPCSRIWLLACNAVQTILVLLAATLQYMSSGRAQPKPTGAHSLPVIALLAFASGSQVVQSRSLACTEISTAMATAAWVDLLIDPRLVMTDGRGNRSRNRRLAFLMVLFAGVLVGAGIYRVAGSAVALFVSAGGKAVVTGMFWFNGAERAKVQEEEAC